MSGKHTGSCLCGAVRFTALGPLRGVVYCHCSQCRKQTGLHYAATNVADDRLVIEGGENITWFAASADARRGFCKTCGSALFWKHSADAHTSILAGAFDNPDVLKGEKHIFVADKPSFYAINDGLPQS